MSRYGHDPIDFGSLDDDYRGYDDRGPEGGRGPLILALAAGVLIVFAAVVWNTYRQGIRTDATPLPVIAADADGFKRLPDEAGGFVAPDQDRRIFDAFEPDEADVAPIRDFAGDEPDALSGGPVASEPDVSLAAAEPADSLPPPAELRRLTAVEEPAASFERAMTEIGEVSEPLLPVPDPTPVMQFQFSDSGPYLVQIAALRDEASALRAWGDYLSAHPNLFRGAAQSVQRADLGSKGVFYRLRAGRFSDRDGAAEFCAALKEVGRDCIVVR